MNLALFPITALLLLLSGVGTPAYLADGTQSATALIKAILGTGPGTNDQAQDRDQDERQRNTRSPQPVPPASRTSGQQPSANPAFVALSTPLQAARLQGTANRKAFRTRFGSIDGAHQSQGPPLRTITRRLG